MITAYKNIYSQSPHYTTIEECLRRIKEGSSKNQVDEIRITLDKERANSLKSNLPSICFSGKFNGSRKDDNLIEHSGFIILDFDNVEEVETLKHELVAKEFVRATWVSPSGNGVKALVCVADKTKHKEHFQALLDIFPSIDKSGINPSRVCYESFDPEIFINDNYKPFTKIKTFNIEKEQVIETEKSKIFDKILKWLSNKGNAFATGERNIFIFKLASACCRFGLDEYETERYIQNSILTNDNTFSNAEAKRTIESAFRSNKNKSGSAFFENDVLVERSNKKEVEIDPNIFDEKIKPKDVLFGEDVKHDAMALYDNGYESAETTEIKELDEYWKWKKGELTLISGIGNYGKSSFLKYILLIKSMRKNWKWALFAPEDFPAHEFYHDLVEIFMGEDMTPRNLNRPERKYYERVYDWISKHFFFVYPKDISSTPDYIKERFLELIIKEKVNGVVIDPFNQLDNDYSKVGGRDDKYLEVVLADFKRFAQVNNIPFIIVAHPKGGIKKDSGGNYECPDVFDLAGGAMWNNKLDNVMIYHRPLRGQNPEASNCEIHTKKIKRQKTVGKIGVLEFSLKTQSRRYLWGDNIDYIEIINHNNRETNSPSSINTYTSQEEPPF
jgi:hypothetical protein